MDRIELSRAERLKGEFSPPPDKSISHRAVILSSLAKGKSLIKNALRSKDVESTINAFKTAGVNIRDEETSLVISGKGLRGLSEPANIIDCGNSGTTMRLVAGVLSGNNFFSVLTGDSSLRRRPMDRIIEPLTIMGADIKARDNNKYPPLAIRGGNLSPVKYVSPIASAQVKSSILLAGLYADGETELTETAKSRDHTEKMLAAQGADIHVSGLTVTIRSGKELAPMEITVPGDFSSASFFLTAALLIPESEIVMKNVTTNPTRTGLLKILNDMGAHIELKNLHILAGEPVADICCRQTSRLKAVNITKELIPSMIDEFPVFCVAAALADGESEIRGAEELRVKESDRITAMAAELRKMGAEIEEYPDGLRIKGTDTLHGAVVDSYGDHRIAMSLAIAALAAEGSTVINGASSVDISFPGFFELVRRLSS